MHSVNDINLLCNKQFKLNFNGGELSSDGGLLMIKKFLSALGFDSLVRESFKTKDGASARVHTDANNLFQMIY